MSNSTKYMLTNMKLNPSNTDTEDKGVLEPEEASPVAQLSLQALAQCFPGKDDLKNTPK